MILLILLCHPNKRVAAQYRIYIQPIVAFTKTMPECLNLKTIANKFKVNLKIECLTIYRQV